MTQLCATLRKLPISMLLLGQIALAQDLGKSAIDKLEALLADTSTLSANVTQLIMESSGGILEESRIRMHLDRPDGFYWETLEPFPELVVTNGKLLWNYQPDLEQVVVEDWNQSRSELAAQLLNGETDSLGEDYRVSLAASEGSRREFDLTPVDADNSYERISISFLGPELDSIHLRARNGEQTVWRFDSVERNHQLPDSLFEFEAPPGIEVINNSYVR